MADVVLPEKRRLMMAGIRARDTKPEMMVRQHLHAAGFRYRLHCRDLPGSPDIVLAKHRLIIFVHGCFWHRHARCHLAATPATRSDFWKAKFEANVVRDAKNIRALQDAGWRVLVIWECGTRSAGSQLVEWLKRWIGDRTARIGQWPERAM
jgi:DNA mismatch endonuclease, patch repair protein